MTVRAHGILIPFLMQTRNCLVVMPYGASDPTYRSRRDRVFDAIKSGADDAGLRAVRVDRRPPGDFLTQLYTDILEATIIVGDCSPNPTSSEPNSNVMYEIGLAHALGKPTILVQSGTEIRLPADLSTEKCVLYNENNDASLSRLTDEVSLQITRTKELLAGSPTHETYLLDPAEIVGIRHAICLHKDFLPHLSRVVKFATTIRHSLQPLDYELSTLKAYTLDLFKDAWTSRDEKLNLIDAAWRNYDTVTSAVSRTICQPLMDKNYSDNFEQVTDSLEFMRKKP